MIGQLQKKLTELSKNVSPATGPADPVDGQPGESLDMEALGLGLAALGEAAAADDDNGSDNGNGAGNDVVAVAVVS